MLNPRTRRSHPLKISRIQRGKVRERSLKCLPLIKWMAFSTPELTTTVDVLTIVFFYTAAAAVVFKKQITACKHLIKKKKILIMYGSAFLRG